MNAFEKEVMIVRLTNGEMLMGFVEFVDANVISLGKPVLLAMGMDQMGKLQVNMMDYIPFADADKFSFDKAHVLNIVKPNEGLMQAFRQKNSKILTPNKPSVIV